MDTYKKFIRDMKASGIEVVEEYHGRYFYVGPAVSTDKENGPTLEDVIRATTVKVQWDNLGLDYIIYPR